MNSSYVCKHQSVMFLSYLLNPVTINFLPLFSKVYKYNASVILLSKLMLIHNYHYTKEILDFWYISIFVFKFDCVAWFMFVCIFKNPKKSESNYPNVEVKFQNHTIKQWS